MHYRIKQIIRTLLILNCLIGSTTFSISTYADEALEHGLRTKIKEDSNIDFGSGRLNSPAKSEKQNSHSKTKSTIKRGLKNKTEIKPSLKKIVSEKIYSKTVFYLLGDAKYADNFDHLDYVNPNAPKGGMIKLAEIGTFDNFNRYASRGVPELNSGEIYDSLFTSSEDDITTYYPLIATSITYSDSYRWAEVILNPDARFQDGVPITAEDVVFSFNKFMTEGVPAYRAYYEGIIVKVLTPYRFRVEIPNSDREKLLSFVGDMKILPKHFWKDHDFSEPLITPPVGSGPYFIRDYKMGQYVVYTRNPNYWAANLPINKGRYNFDQKRIEYYMDKNVALEAFKSGEYDFIGESQPKNWNSQYQGRYFDLGYIVKQEKPITTATNSQWLAFNLQNKLFNDINVRRALTLAFDFEWLNRAFYYNSYKRPTSFFENTIYAAQGIPSQAELKWLKPFKGDIPDAVFGEAYQLPKSDGSGFNRQNLLKATELLKMAGWVIKNGVLTNKKTGQPFEFELITYMGSDIKYAIPFQKNLARLGITMNIASLDYAQITRRMRKRDYDMMPTVYTAMNYPTSDLVVRWGSQYLNSSWNSSGLHNQAIDSLIAEITKNLDNKDQLIPLAHALDRILTHEYAMIPMWYPNSTYYAYWDKFGQPLVKPTYAIGLSSWWFDTKKAAHLPKNQSF